MVKYAVYDWDSTVPVVFIDPPTVKKAFKAAGNKKEQMSEALSKLAELQFPGTENLDEHSVDALAVAYGRLLTLRNIARA